MTGLWARMALAGDDADVAARGVEQAPHLEHVLLAADEGMRDKGHVGVNGKLYVRLVALGESRQVDAHARHVDALARAEGGGVFHQARHVFAGLFLDNQTEVAVVDQDVHANLHVPHEVRIRHGDALARRGARGVAHDAHAVALLKTDGRLAGRSAHLGPLGVDQDGNAARHLAHVVDDAPHALRALVRRVQPYDVHTGVVKLLYEVDAATGVGHGSYNLGFLIHLFTSDSFQERRDRPHTGPPQPNSASTARR